MTEKPKAGRKATGTITKTKTGLWQAIVTLADGTRKRLPPFPKGTSEAMARAKTERMAEDVMKLGLVRAEPAETTDATAAPTESAEGWFTSWLTDRVARGFTSTKDSAGHWRIHIRPCFGDRHPKTWTRDDFRKLSRELDGKVQSHALSWKSAVNIWGTATKMADDATESKHDTIRCRDDNPADGVRGPDRGDDRDKQFLYPSEFLRFAGCQEVPLRWRRLVAAAIYLYPRDGELRALECEDTDTEHGIAHITKARSKKTGLVQSTKSGRRRHVPIEPSIVPLLEALKAEAGQRGALFPDFPSERDMARGLRRWLKRAGVTRRDLHEKTPTTVPLTFHDLRATGITWMAIRGDDPLKIMQRAGHEDFETTKRYMRAAEVLREGFGDVFPRLPAELYESTDARAGFGDDDSELMTISEGESITKSITLAQLRETMRGGRDSNPRPPA
ncbi:MAG: site-specific integrase [Myxococcales bacterium]|nr:site-specific integrase [Myxococcales bacterium]